jgi:hypothetical protein
VIDSPKSPDDSAPALLGATVPGFKRRFELLYSDLGRLPLKGEKLTVGSDSFTVDAADNQQDERYVEVIVRGD